MATETNCISQEGELLIGSQVEKKPKTILVEWTNNIFTRYNNRELYIVINIM